jgi:hypothetical protein
MFLSMNCLSPRLASVRDSKARAVPAGEMGLAWKLAHPAMRAINMTRTSSLIKYSRKLEIPLLFNFYIYQSIRL